MFLRTIAEHEASGRVAEIYAKQKADLGFVMEAMQCWTTREDLLPLYMDFTYEPMIAPLKELFP